MGYKQAYYPLTQYPAPRSNSLALDSLLGQHVGWATPYWISKRNVVAAEAEVSPNTCLEVGQLRLTHLGAYWNRLAHNHATLRCHTSDFLLARICLCLYFRASQCRSSWVCLISAFGIRAKVAELVTRTHRHHSRG